MASSDGVNTRKQRKNTSAYKEKSAVMPFHGVFFEKLNSSLSPPIQNSAFSPAYPDAAPALRIKSFHPDSKTDHGAAR